MQLSPFQLSHSRARLGWVALLLVLAWAGHVLLAADAPPNLEKALAAQYEMVAERPYDPTVQNDLGNLLMLADREAEAEEAYRRALEIDGSHRAARFNLALVLQSRGKHSEAVKHLATLVELDPRHAWAHYQKGVSHERLGQRRAAIRHYARAFALDPGLTFAENNPQIIDNELATEALLVSGGEAVGATRRVPRQYDEAERIAELMLEAPPKPPAEATPLSTGDPAEMTPEAMDVEAPATGEGRPGTAEPLRSEAEGETGDGAREPVAAGGEGDDGEENDDPEEPKSRRVITADDLPSGRSGGAVEGGGERTRDRDTREPTRGEVTPPQTPRRDRSPSVTDRGSRQGTTRYRPSRRSSASLELKLLPESETLSAG